MTEHAPHHTARHYDPMLPEAIMLPAIEMWQKSLTIGTAWWNCLIDAWWPEHPLHQVPSHDPHSQLVVPEPIEADGERALVA